MLAATRDHALQRSRYPRANAYDPSWVFANEMGPNALWLMEWLCAAVDLQPGMRALDMGCGRAMSSTDDTYLGSFHQYVRPGGPIGIVVPGLTRELPAAGVPEHLRGFWDPKECFSFHSLAWWRRHLDQSQVLDLETADLLPDGCDEWASFARAQVAAGAVNREGTAAEAEQVAADGGRYLGFIRVVGRRRGEAG